MPRDHRNHDIGLLVQFLSQPFWFKLAVTCLTSARTIDGLTQALREFPVREVLFMASPLLVLSTSSQVSVFM